MLQTQHFVFPLHGFCQNAQTFGKHVLLKDPLLVLYLKRQVAGDVFRKIQRIVAAEGIDNDLFGHFGHLNAEILKSIFHDADERLFHIAAADGGGT